MGTGSSEFAISNAPRVSAPSSGRGDGVRVFDAHRAGFGSPPQRFGDRGERVALVEFGVASQTGEHRRAVDDQDSLYIGLQDSVEERVDPLCEIFRLSAAPCAALVASVIKSVWACSKTASNRSDLVGKWW